MSVIAEARELYLWCERDGKDVCCGRIIGWSRWTSDYDSTDKYSPVVAKGQFGDGAHAQVMDTEHGAYYVSSHHAGPDEVAA
jgi:hypothetical protein